MPELPEMENYKIRLEDKLLQQVITDVQINREKSINLQPELFKNTVHRQKVVMIIRRGKQLLFHLENGYVLLVHLMLGGWMFFGSESEKPKRTIQVSLSFGEEHLYFIGLRLGYLHLLSQKEVEEKLAHLGPEPLDTDFSLNKFLLRIKTKHGRLKTALLDQEFIAGIGNCYSAEICFQAAINPIKNIDEITTESATKLYQSMLLVLKNAIKHGGYMGNPVHHGDTVTGRYNQQCQVYDREGQSCLRCGAIIVQTVISSRKTFFCPNCQT
ncbi:DNA-formamidopyrimidine glycosylase [Neobacillus jeddahensis]|uniref:DNA-formamidopyrimidine glycosylase n=1 Tax=Neobacillus jeddahensis TaxID=1461580 RepID=UPI00058EA243|nr:DNA-formamidopyrimidine glycosylase [Neobacillus jeddahensis]